MQGCGAASPIKLPDDHNFIPTTGQYNRCSICAFSLAFHKSQAPKPDSHLGPGWVWNRENHPFRRAINAWICITCEKEPEEHWEKQMSEDRVTTVHEFRPMSGDSVRGGLPPVCDYCGRERNDHEYHITYEMSQKAQLPEDFKDKVTFPSGATSGGIHSPYSFMAWEGVRLTALRYEYGNQKHEDGQNILAEANWLKAFHRRDMAFFQDRMTHAIDHLQAESSGHRDKAPGGNLGAVGWCQDVMSFVAKYDPEFYAAVTRITGHPGERKDVCQCPRCQVMIEYYNKAGSK